MASKTVVELVDDLDGGPAHETVSFALDGIEYTIDLSEEHATLLRDRFAGYIGRARQVEGRARHSAGDEVVTLTPHAMETPKAAPAAPRRTKRTTRRTNHVRPVEEPDESVEPAEAESAPQVATPAPVPPAVPAVPAVPVTPAPEQPPAVSGPLAALAVPFQEATH